MLKLVFYFFIFIIFPVTLSAQQGDSLFFKKKQPSIDKHLQLNKDSSSKIGFQDSQMVKIDTAKIDSVKKYIPSYQYKLQRILSNDSFLNVKGSPVAIINKVKKKSTQDSLFFTILILVTLLSLLRFFYVKYFNNLFRVFFNTSLRQSQLTDQLVQAKLQSLFFNIISIGSFGLFIYFLLKYFNWVTSSSELPVIFLSMLCIAGVYLIKFLILKFIGWVTGFKEVTNRYIFIIFLINKILGILLLPFILFMAFASAVLIKIAALLAILLTSLMFLMRFYRSYGLLQHQLKFNRLHFCIYIVGTEIMPVLLIYKGLVLLLSKNL